MTQAYTQGDINVTTVQLFNFTKSFSQDISQQVTAIEIYESIFTPVIFAEIIMHDSINLHERFPIKGEEWLLLQGSAPGLPKKYSFNFNFRVIQKTNLSVDAQGKTSSYKLIAVSEEFQTNAKSVVRKTYNNVPITSMIKDLLTNSQFLNTKKKVITDGGETKGNQYLTVPNFNPIQAIDFLRQRAVSEKYTTSAFVFFENKNGFNFTTLEYLFDAGRKTKSTNPIFFFKTVGNVDLKLNDVEQTRNIISYKHIVAGDPISSANRGGFQNRVVNYDIRTATHTDTVTKKTSVSQNAYYGDAKSIHSSSELNREMEEREPVNTVFFLTNSKKPPTFRELTIGASKIYVEQMVQNIVRVLVSGDTNLFAGKMVTLDLPQFRGTTEDGDKSRKSKYVSGNYIITKIKHTLIHEARWQHRTVMECVKGAFGSG